MKTEVRLPMADARDVVFAEVLESDPKWRPEDARRATTEAKQLAGDHADDPAKLLPLRARLVMARMDAAQPPKLPGTFWPTMALGLAALLFGAFSDQLTAEHARINLLAPPFLALLLWNLAIYVSLMVRLLLKPFRRGNVEEPREEGMLALLRTRLRRVLPGAKPRERAFFDRWSRVTSPLVGIALSRAFHLAAAMFALGWVLSVALRGIGTAYVVGWESTWLAQRPDVVASILKLTYPFAAANLDAAGAAALNFASSMSSPADAAPWLLQIIITVLAVIWLPRGLLGLIAQLRLRNPVVTLPLRSDYTRSILEADRPFSLLLPAEADKLWREAAEALPGCRVLDADLWGDQEPQSAPSPAALVLNAAATPEDDVHGRHAESLPKPRTVVLDASELSRRFDADKIASRLALWETFAAQHHARLKVFGRDPVENPVEARIRLLEELRSPVK